MWEIGNYWTERVNNVPTIPSIHANVHEIHVLLVDHDTETLIQTADQLQMCQYRVSYADVAHAAIPMLLSNDKAKYDVVMVNITSNDPNGLKLFQLALNLCIPVVWLSEDDNATLAMRALENGAFLCIAKPPAMEFLRCLWQHVIREKARMQRERDILIAKNNLEPVRGVEFREVVHQRMENPSANPNPNPNPNSNPNFLMKNKGKYKSKGRGRHENYDDEYDTDNHMMSPNGNVRRKMCTEWTQELHAKFMAAVEELGEGRCFPRDILERMNELGLTRMQVASHLQKCRNDNWRSPEERKPTNATPLSSNGSRPQSKPRRFGIMPLPNKPSSSQSHSKNQEMGQSSETHWETRTPNNGVKVGSGSTMPNNTHHYGNGTYFNFSDVDSLINDFPGRQHEPDINNPDPTQEGYQVNPAAYNEEKNSGEASVKSKSN